MTDTNPAAPIHPRRRLSNHLSLALVALCAMMLLLAIIGRTVRDRSVFFALLMYLPPLPIAAATIVAVIVRLILRPRAATTWFVALGIIALLAGLWNIADMTGRAPASGIVGERANLTLIQWNVQWGGREIFPEAWEPTARAILANAPDILVLNEGPADERIAQLCRDLGDTWTFASRGHPPKSRYWYKLAVAARWPVRFEREVTLSNGAAMSVRVDAGSAPGAGGGWDQRPAHRAHADAARRRFTLPRRSRRGAGG